MPTPSSQSARLEPLERRVLLSLAPLGDVFRAADTEADIMASDLGMDGDGDYTFVWQRRPRGFPVTDFIDSRVFSRVGLTVGEVTTVEDTPEYLDVSPSMGMDRNGEFAVAWMYSAEIRVRLFRSDGLGKGPSAVVAVAPDAVPSLAMNPMGQFAVAWASGNKIFARAFNADGSARTGVVEVSNSDGVVARSSPSIAVDHAGGFVVTWRHNQNGLTSVRARRFTPAGFSGVAETVMQSAVALGEGPLAGSDAAGNFVVVWQGADGIRARRGFASGATRGPAFPVEPATTAARGIDLAAEGDGDFIVSWNGLDAVYCKQFNSIGQPVGEKVAIHGAAGGDTHLAIDGGGTMAVVDWRSSYVTQGGVLHHTIEGRRVSVTQPPDPGPDPYPDPVPVPGPPGNTAPTTSGVADVAVEQDAPNTAIPLFDSFADAQDGDGALYYGLTGNTNVALFSAVIIDNVTGVLTLDYAPGASGAATLTVRATDTGGASVQTSFGVTVRPAAPTPGPGPTPDPAPAPTPNPNPVGSPPVPLGNGALAGRLITKARGRRPAGLAGVVVFIDTNLNGGWDADELSATTDALGSYAFTGLAAGRYRIRAATPAGYELVGARRDGGLRNAVIRAKQRKPAKVKPLVLKAPAV